MLDRAGASFFFEEMAESLIEADVACRLSTGELILEATRRVQDPDLVRRVIGDSEPRAGALRRTAAARAEDHAHARRTASSCRGSTAR